MTQDEKRAANTRLAKRRGRLERIRAAATKRQKSLREMSIDGRWKLFRAAHPQVFARALAIAQSDIANGNQRITIASIWERMRGKVGVPLDNTLRSVAARSLVAAEPRLRGRIEMRQRRRA